MGKKKDNKEKKELEKMYYRWKKVVLKRTIELSKKLAKRKPTYIGLI